MPPVFGKERAMGNSSELCPGAPHLARDHTMQGVKL